MAKAKAKAKKKRRRRAAGGAVQILGTAASFAKAREIHTVPMGEKFAALVREPTLAEIKAFDQAADKAEGDSCQGVDVGGMMAFTLIVTEQGEPVFKSIEAAVKALGVSQLAALGKFIEGVSSVARAEGN